MTNDFQHKKTIPFDKETHNCIVLELNNPQDSMTDFQIGNQIFRTATKVEWLNLSNKSMISTNIDVGCKKPFDFRVESRDINDEIKSLTKQYKK